MKKLFKKNFPKFLGKHLCIVDFKIVQQFIKRELFFEILHKSFFLEDLREITSSLFFPVAIYLIKVNNGNIGAMFQICSKKTRKTPERRHWRCSGLSLVKFEHISHTVLVFLFLTFIKQMAAVLVTSLH